MKAAASALRMATVATIVVAAPLLMEAQVHHYEYVFPPGQVTVYDADNHFALVKSIPVPTSAGIGVQGSVASAATGMLYLAYGSNASGGSLLKYDLVNDQVVWTMTYSFGIDSMAITPDGKTIYMPSGENNSSGLWEIIDAATGNVTGSISTGTSQTHNTLITPTGSHVYMGAIGSNSLIEADASTNAILQRIGPVTSFGGTGVRPFTINGAETLAFMNATGVLGFQVGSIATGKILYTVPVTGFTCGGCGGAPSHGISISPDEKEVYVRDGPNSYVHVYDVTGLPGSAPKQVADIPMVSKSKADGWLHHSRDGHYVFDGDSGDVIDTTTRTVVAYLPALSLTARTIEIDFQNGVPVWAMSNRSSTGQVTGLSTGVDTLMFHGDRQRTGWRSTENLLSPASVSGGLFGPVWNSPPFDSAVVGGVTYAAHVYASPLYIDTVTMSSGPYAGTTFSVVLAASSNGFVYAINASTTTAGGNLVLAGTILWQVNLGSPIGNANMLDGVPFGVLSTPIVDTSVSPPRLYVTCADAAAGWRVFALDLTSGSTLPGWPLAISNSNLSALNQNGPTVFESVSAMSQRGALNLSFDGKLLYVPFGGYTDGAAGWMVVVDTQTPSLSSAFAGAPSSSPTANAGMWGSGGPAIDTSGKVYMTTGNGETIHESTSGYWGNSFLAWNAGTPLKLSGSYTPFNYCQMDQNDVDLGGGSPLVIPSLTSTGTTTPNLVAFGGKQGNMYLVDRDHLLGSLVGRQGCGTDASLDKSLLPPGTQPQFGTRGPLNVFGPYSESFNTGNTAKARGTPAYFQTSDGTAYVFSTGSNKAAVDSAISVPPGIARLKVIATTGQPAYLSVDGYENTLSLISPGPPVITSNGYVNSILWMLDANVLRTSSLTDPLANHPILYALDPFSLQVLWQTTTSELNVGGRYNTPAVARGTVFVGTDRIQAFGLTAATIIATAGTPQSTAINTAFATILQATVKDPMGNPISGVTVTFTAPGNGPSGIFGGLSASATGMTDSNGIATAPAFAANSKTGTYIVSANAPGSGVATFTMTNTPGPPAAISATAGTPQFRATGTAFATALQARVTDASNNAIAGATVTFTAPATGASAAFGASATASILTDNNGVATAPTLTANGLSGTYSVTAGVSGVSTPASFTLTNVLPGSGTLLGSGTSAATLVNLTAEGIVDWVHWGDSSLNRKKSVPAQLSTFTIVGGGGSTTYSNDPRPINWTDGAPTVSGTNNKNGVYVSGIGHGFSFTAPADTTSRTLLVHVGGWNSGGQLTARLSDGSAADFVDTTATASGQFDRNYVIGYHGAIAGQTLSVTWKMNSGGGNVTLNAAALGSGVIPASIATNGGTPQTIAIGGAFPNPLQAIVKDVSNNPVNGVPVTFAAPGTGASGTFSGSATVTTDVNGVATAPAFTANMTAGSYSVMASTPGVAASASFSLTNQTGPPASVTATGGTPQGAAISTAFAAPLVATVKDAGGNLVNNATVTFTAPGSGASGTFTGGLTTSGVPTIANGTATSPIFTANGTSGAYAVTASVSGVASSASFTLTNNPPTVSGSLSGVGDSVKTVAVVSTEGGSDWVHWGDSSLNRKAGVTAQISTYTLVGGGSATKYSNDPRPLSWIGGTPTATGTNNLNGLYNSGVGKGFSITVPADTTTRTLIVHLGGWNSGGTLTAHLSDGSAADFVNTTATVSGQYDRNYTLTYSAGAAGKTLTVTWKMASGSGNVTLNGAALK